MRKVTWIILLTIAFIWLAIATYWTGTGDTTKQLDFPPAPPITPEEISPTPPVASSSPEILLSPGTTPSGDIDLRY